VSAKLEVTIYSYDENETISMGEALGKLLIPGNVVLLMGDLGAGKTRFTQGILSGMGSNDYVKSPTFVLITEYQASCTVYHMDLYRLDTQSHIDRMFLDEYLDGDGVCIVEWADKANGIFPYQSITIKFTRVTDNERIIRFESQSIENQCIFDFFQEYGKDD
jgi:tRNA threonylcarbamoyladenosine biosynthesis protein TsaE